MGTEACCLQVVTVQAAQEVFFEQQCLRGAARRLQDTCTKMLWAWREQGARQVWCHHFITRGP